MSEIGNIAMVGITGAVAVGTMNAVANGMQQPRRRRRRTRQRQMRMW